MYHTSQITDLNYFEVIYLYALDSYLIISFIIIQNRSGDIMEPCAVQASPQLSIDEDVKPVIGPLSGPYDWSARRDVDCAIC